MIHYFILISNPFLDSYFQSDWLGKAIFIGLFALSILTWSVTFYQLWTSYQAKRKAKLFKQVFQFHKETPLDIEEPHVVHFKNDNPFLAIYSVLKDQTLSLLERNRVNRNQELLTSADITLLQSELKSAKDKEIHVLDKNLFILSAVVSLAPFLGLLGTVWGILTTFSHLQEGAMGGSTNDLVLGGLSLALATTVLGLIDAIPALICYHLLKNQVKGFELEMQEFSTSLVTAVEMQYRND